MVIRIGDTCKRGHIIDGDNVQHYVNRGNPHVRCKQCNMPPNEKKKIGDYCKSGHQIVGDNILRRSLRGIESFACRTCSLEASRRYRRSDKYLQNPKYVKNREHSERLRRQVDYGLYGKAGVPYSDIAKREDAIDNKIRRDPTANNIVELLINADMNKRSRDAMRAMVASPSYNDAKCVGKTEVYVDYEVEPTINEAFKLCDGCPLLVECGRFANANGPDHGVWAGEVWKQGRVKKHDR